MSQTVYVGVLNPRLGGYESETMLHITVVLQEQVSLITPLPLRLYPSARSVIACTSHGLFEFWGECKQPV